MKPNDPYWQERFESLEASRHDKSVEKVREVVRNLSNAEKEIIADIEMWYGRYAGEQGVSYAEAKKRLTVAELRRFKMSVEEYIRKASDFVEAETWQKQLREMSARVHVARLQSLLIQVQAAVEAAYQSINAEITSYLSDALQDEYFRAAYELQVGVGYGVSVAALDTRTIESILEKAWAADGVNFSGRIWQERATLVNKVAQIISQGVARGIGAKEMAQQLDDVTEQVSAAIKTRMSNCERLILTETAFFRKTPTFEPSRKWMSRATSLWQHSTVARPRSAGRWTERLSSSRIVRLVLQHLRFILGAAPRRFLSSPLASAARCVPHAMPTANPSRFRHR